MDGLLVGVLAAVIGGLLVAAILALVGPLPALAAGVAGVIAVGAVVAIRRRGRPPRARWPDPKEDPARTKERKAVRDEAKKVADTYRAMSRMNGIDQTPDDARLEWRARVDGIGAMRDAHMRRWRAKLPGRRDWERVVAPVRVEWLDDMVAALEFIVWQLDHEQAGVRVVPRFW